MIFFSLVVVVVLVAMNARVLVPVDVIHAPARARVCNYTTRISRLVEEKEIIPCTIIRSIIIICYFPER